MPLVDFTDSDLLRGRILSPAWYRISIDKVNDWAPSKNGQSNNCLIECTVLRNADTGETESLNEQTGKMEKIAGVPVYIQFNDSPKAKGFIQGFFQALGYTLESGQRYDLAGVQGKQITAFIENETYEGKVRNRINHKYRAEKV